MEEVSAAFCSRVAMTFRETFSRSVEASAGGGVLDRYAKQITIVPSGRLANVRSHHPGFLVLGCTILSFF
jgi:hypothetical protein